MLISILIIRHYDESWKKKLKYELSQNRNVERFKKEEFIESQKRH